ncbi:MAG TPA: hypothetical protein VND92_07100, partial [Vicinamibacterales bacterium]|nr:hypothetical protein [Vicinamibacterales bacterium]
MTAHASVGDFIRLYLTRYEHWTSPLFLAGESYGTTRAAGLSGYLVDPGAGRRCVHGPRDRREAAVAPRAAGYRRQATVLS